MAPVATSSIQEPPAITHNSAQIAFRCTAELPAELINAARFTEPGQFDASKHVCFQYPEKIYSMEEIGFPGKGNSATAVSAPFPLLTLAAVEHMRSEVFSERVLNEYRFQSGFVKDKVLGMMPHRARFTYDAWYSEEVLSKVSEVAGVDLMPVMDMEISAINVLTNDRTNYPTEDIQKAKAAEDCTRMVGGETALKTASGEVMKVRGLAMGTAVIMQGRYLNHAALKAFAGRERISQITSLRPRSPLAKDESVLTGVRSISNVSDLYTQLTRYRLENLQYRVQEKLKNEKTRENFDRECNLEEMRSWFTENIAYMQATLAKLQEVS